MSYSTFKNSVIGKQVGDGECVSLVVNNAAAYAEFLYPGVSWPSIFGPVTGAKDLFNSASSAYWTKIVNDHNNPNQVPLQGDVMVFDATPHVGYSNTFNNPYGHTGICESADANGYVLLQQNAPAFKQAVNATAYGWKMRPCIGWLRPISSPSPAPAPTPPPAQPQHTIYLPPTTGPWHLYPENGPYVPSAAKGIIVPSQFGGLTYPIVADHGNGIIVIQSQMYGRGALWTNGSQVIIK